MVTQKNIFRLIRTKKTKDIIHVKRKCGYILGDFSTN